MTMKVKVWSTRDERVLVVQRRFGDDEQGWVDHLQFAPEISIEYAGILMGRMTRPNPRVGQRLIERRTLVTEELLEP